MFVLRPHPIWREWCLGGSARAGAMRRPEEQAIDQPYYTAITLLVRSHATITHTLHDSGPDTSGAKQFLT